MKIEKNLLVKKGILLIHVEFDLAKACKAEGNYAKYLRHIERCRCQAEMLYKMGLLKSRHYQMLKNIIDKY